MRQRALVRSVVAMLVCQGVWGPSIRLVRGRQLADRVPDVLGPIHAVRAALADGRPKQRTCGARVAVVGERHRVLSGWSSAGQSAGMPDRGVRTPTSRMPRAHIAARWPWLAMRRSRREVRIPEEQGPPMLRFSGHFPVERLRPIEDSAAMWRSSHCLLSPRASRSDYVLVLDGEVRLVVPAVQVLGHVLQVFLPQPRQRSHEGAGRWT